MNALHKLSRIYAEGKISREAYKRERKVMIGEILAGKLMDQTNITLVPSSSATEETQKLPVVKARAPLPKKSQGKFGLIKYMAWALLVMLPVLGVLLFTLHPPFADLIEQTSPWLYKALIKLVELLPSF